jgi:hypothetical protein
VPVDARINLFEVVFDPTGKAITELKVPPQQRKRLIAVRYK